IPFFPFFNKKSNSSYFLALVLENEKVNAVIFEEIEGKIKIVGNEEKYFNDSIEKISPEEMLDALDKAISQAEQSLPNNTQALKTIFGVKEDWVENNRIKKDYLLKLKKVSDELGLTPIGFLIVSEAVCHLLEKEEGAPVSAIFIDPGEKFVTVSLIRAGRIIEAKVSEIHESLAFTVDSLLKHFTSSDILPSRIIIFESSEDIVQEFIGHQWSRSLPFLHLPQITTLPAGFDAKAVLLGAASQMGFEVLDEIIEKEERQEFKIEKDLEEVVKPEEPKEEPVEEPKEEIAAKPIEYFGFVKDQDVVKSLPKKIVEEPKLEEKIIAERIEEIPEELKAEGVEENQMVIKDFIFGLLKIIKKSFAKRPSFHIPSFSGGKTIFVFLGIFILIMGFFVFYIFGVKATIIVKVDPKIISENQDVIFSSTSPTSLADNIISGEFVTVSKDTQASTPATGKKDVGDKAKGTVTIFNLSKNTKTLSAGTEISLTNDLKFVLDNSVTVASASSSTDSNFNVITKPSTVSVNITADQLGKESNLPSGTKFSVSSFDTSDLIAKNDNPFSGGTKKQVTVVSKDDVSKLTSDLTKTQEQSARNDLLKNLPSDKNLLPAFIDETVSKKVLDTNIGDEAATVTLKGEVTYEGLSFSKNELVNLAKSVLANKIPNAPAINYDNIKVDVTNIKVKNDKEINANLSIKALLLPKIETNKILSQIKGISYKEAENKFLSISQVSDVTISSSPNIPFFPKNLPRNAGNITIVIKANE
ncbi:MAG: baseplate J/gp47 family protein, partial [Patescibacteria group bacterium]